MKKYDITLFFALAYDFLNSTRLSSSYLLISAKIRSNLYYDVQGIHVVQVSCSVGNGFKVVEKLPKNWTDPAVHSTLMGKEVFMLFVLNTTKYMHILY
jgi:hypothetical protein